MSRETESRPKNINEELAGLTGLLEVSKQIIRSRAEEILELITKSAGVVDPSEKEKIDERLEEALGEMMAHIREREATKQRIKELEGRLASAAG